MHFLLCNCSDIKTRVIIERYLIELITPERDILSRRNIIERTAQRRQHRLDRGAFKKSWVVKKFRELSFINWNKNLMKVGTYL